MRLPNGKIIYSDPTKADTDGDGLKDGEEIIPVPIPYFKSIPDANGKLKPVKGYLFLMRSNPNLKDSDGDGLQDGSARYVNGKKVIPKDPEPLSANGPVGIWQEQYRQEVSGKRIAHKLGTWYKMDWNIGSIFAGIGSRILNFKSDEKDNCNDGSFAADGWRSDGLRPAARKERGDRSCGSGCRHAGEIGG